MLDTIALLAQDAAAKPAEPNLLSFLMPLMVVIFLYIILIQRPAAKDKQNRQNQLNSLQKGDNVITIGGLCGRVESVDKEARRVTISVDKNTKLTFLQTAVERVEKKTGKGVQKDKDGANANQQATKQGTAKGK
jgi:preprotein translocase subunit YajC